MFLFSFLPKLGEKIHLLLCLFVMYVLRQKEQTALLHWLPVNNRTDLKALLLVCKLLNGGGPKYLTNMFHQYTSARPLRSLEQNMLVIPTVGAQHGEAAFSCC